MSIKEITINDRSAVFSGNGSLPLAVKFHGVTLSRHEVKALAEEFNKPLPAPKFHVFECFESNQDGMTMRKINGLARLEMEIHSSHTVECVFLTVEQLREMVKVMEEE